LADRGEDLKVEKKVQSGRSLSPAKRGMPT